MRKASLSILSVASLFSWSDAATGGDVSCELSRLGVHVCHMTVDRFDKGPMETIKELEEQVADAPDRVYEIVSSVDSIADFADEPALHLIGLLIDTAGEISTNERDLSTRFRWLMCFWSVILSKGINHGCITIWGMRIPVCAGLRQVRLGSGGGRMRCWSKRSIITGWRWIRRN